MTLLHNYLVFDSDRESEISVVCVETLDYFEGGGVVFVERGRHGNGMEHLERKGWFCKVIEFKNIFIKKKKLSYLLVVGHHAIFNVFIYIWPYGCNQMGWVAFFFML